jgi:hypothetical protein
MNNRNMGMKKTSIDYEKICRTADEMISNVNQSEVLPVFTGDEKQEYFV